MNRHSSSRWIFVFYFLFFTLALIFPPSVSALEFGINKIRYHTHHEWQILETEHFQVYYYQKCGALARVATQYAEKAFLTTSKIFDYVPKNKIPLFIYGTSLEFQETNISPEYLPEGVGGFTEVFKNRIAVPMTGSYYEFGKVIHHELTHAFQYDLIYGEGWRSINLFKTVLVPTWMMEGMAEWNAQHIEGQGEMVLRDAVLNDQLIPLNLLDSFGHFEQVYMAYKESQSILDYVSQVYGPEKVVQMMKKMAMNQPPSTVTKNLLGISMDELYDNWHFFIKSQAWGRINGMPDPSRYGEVLEPEAAKAAISPDGKTVAYLTSGELGLIDLITKKKSTLLNRSFQTQGSGVEWSPDGNFLALSIDRDGEYGLYIYDLLKKRLTECRVSDLPVVYSPAWSPDGRYLVFTGFDYQSDDLYRYEISTGRLDRLTHDLTTKSWAQYSPDGKSIYFIDEDGGETLIKRMGLDLDGLPQGNSTPVVTELGTVSSLRTQKNTLYFTSNRNNRIFNLFKIDSNGTHLTQLSNTFADVLSVAPAPDEKTLYVNIYQKSKESLYAFSMERLENQEQPRMNLSYLSNSFQNAAKVIANSSPPQEILPEADNFQKAGSSEVETPKVKKIPVQPPPSIGRLEVEESSNLVQLKWTSLDPENQMVNFYRIYRSTSAGATFVYVGKTSNVMRGTYADFDVENNRNYYYYVTVVNSAGESPPSAVVEAHPSFKIESKKYDFALSPDILLFLAGYDSSIGFLGGGVVQMSDYLGDHRLGIIGNTIPSVQTGVEANYEFSQWRTTVDLDFFYYQNYFNIYDLQSGSIVNQYRNNENGLSLNFNYPIDTSTRFEYGLGTQRFLGSPLYLQFSEGISNYAQNADQWTVANFYRLAFVRDRRKGTHFWPSSGYALNFTLLHALPVLDDNVSFANLLLESDVFADIGFLNHLVWANRFVGMTSQGMNPQSFFIGPDQPFQAYFTTLRGYGGNIYFGSNLGLWNTELRYPIATNLNFVLPPLNFLLIKDIELAGFMDTGVISGQIQSLPTSPILNSIGTGIRFYAFLFERALVMLRFDVAWRNDQSAPPTFHFNLMPMF